MPCALKHPNPHPLVHLFVTKGLSECVGMNLLQDGPERFISDLCVEPSDVAPGDVVAVLQRARAEWAIPRAWVPEFAQIRDPAIAAWHARQGPPSPIPSAAAPAEESHPPVPTPTPPTP